MNFVSYKPMFTTTVFLQSHCFNNPVDIYLSLVFEGLNFDDKSLESNGTFRVVLKSNFLDFNRTAYAGKGISGINRSTGPSLTASPMHTTLAGSSSENEPDALPEGPEVIKSELVQV